MKTTEIVKNVEKLVRDNSTVILTAVGVSGTISTAYLAGKASYRAAIVLEHKQRTDDMAMTPKEKAKHVWRLYIPAALSGVTTVACIVSSNRIGTRKTAAAYSLLTVSEKAFEEYKEKVIETVGVRKEQNVRDTIAQDKVTNNPVANNQVIITQGGNVLCCELFTGRYFRSDMETLRRAENEINARILREMYANLSDFYSIIGLPYTSNSCDIGWNSDRLMKLKFSTVLSEDGNPCIAFDYDHTKPL